jgi:hypothetical protein
MQESVLIPKPINHFLDVPGFNNPKHLKALGDTAAEVTSGRVLEIGPAFGCSTWVLMDNLQPGVKLHSVDTFGMNNMQLKLKHFRGIMEKHRENSAVNYAMSIYMNDGHRAVFDHTTSHHPRRWQVLEKVHQKRSLELLAEDTNWDMVYIDGLHSYENVIAELNYLENVPLLCGDDYHPAHPGTMKAIDEFVAKRNLVLDHHDFESGSGFWKIYNA